jgi:hypothetical protein
MTALWPPSKKKTSDSELKLREAHPPTWPDHAKALKEE